MVEALSLAAAGATLAVRCHPGSGDPVVLLHGGPGMGDYFGSLARMLSPPLRVVTYDQRGCGASRCDGTFDVAAQVEDLETIRRHLGAERLHLFGHSWGGLLAQLYAKAHPDRVASVVLCCSMANTGAAVSKMESRGVAERVIARKRITPAWIAAGLLMQMPGRLGDLGFGFAMKQLMPLYVSSPAHAPADFDARRVSKRAWRATNASVKQLGDGYLDGLSIAAPVLIIQGEEDVIRETNQILSARFPAAANIRIEKTAHFPWLERPEVFADAVHAFYGTAARAG